MDGRAAALLGVPAGQRTTVAPRRVLLDGDTAARMLETAGAPVDPGRWIAVPRAGPLPGALRAARDLALPPDPVLAGLPSVVAVDEGLIRSDDVVVGAEADAAALGGLGALVVHASDPELAALTAEPTMTIVAPQSVAVRIEGRLPRGAAPFDLAVAVHREAMQPGAVLELSGKGVAALTCPQRLALCGALARLGAVGMVLPDETTATWLAARQVHRSDEAGATPEATDPSVTIDASKVAVSVVVDGRPASPSGERIDEILIGGRVEDLRTAVETLRDHAVAEGMHLVWVASSQRTLLHALEEGLLVQFLRAGGTVMPPGSTVREVDDGRRRLVTPEVTAATCMSGPGVAAATAVTGELIDPERMRRTHRRAARRL